MDPLGKNKIMAAILGAALVFMMIRTVPEFIMHHDYPEIPAYYIGEPPAAEEGEEIELPFPQVEWVNAMDADRGANVFKKCTSCHNVEPGGRNGTGPALYNVVGNVAGIHEGFAYSGVMADSGLVWDYAALDAFLEKPARYMPGTKMNFVGLRKAEDRAAVIEYLRVADDNPEPRPEPAPGPLDLLPDEDVTIPPEDIVEVDPTLDPSNTDEAEGGTEAEVLTPEEIDEVD